MRLNLNSHLKLQQVLAPRAGQPRITSVVPGYGNDTLHQIQVRYAPNPRRSRYIELVYTGKIGEGYYTDHVNFLSGHSEWLPYRPYQEYEVLPYKLTVQVPPGYQVRSTVRPSQQKAGRWTFQGTTSAIELTAFVAKQFYETVSAVSPPITLVKTGAPLARTDSVMLRQGEVITAFYNRTIGRQDPITRFTIFLPGTNRGAYGLLDDATIITYPDFDVAKTEDLLVLAHEISHKWWGYGSFHDETDWLNEAFATYSSLLYLQASGDEAGYQKELNRLAQTTTGTPPLWGFDRYKYEYPMHRRVIYNKGTGILHALRTRIGNAQFLQLLATSAARKTSTTTEFLQLVEQVAGPETSVWLLAELKR
ncbi:M1 family aminopeptidase [Hymenobacter lapidiphilus]|uniref:M1 family aminopeptidase n=1 Tax=Hymenobacter sp. CCM 8763 TaxID=2303334 RepID=UPI0011C0E70B|nr:M1 family aminopeptidase [Hymenobacter sp. CCM 8763]